MFQTNYHANRNEKQFSKGPYNRALDPHSFFAVPDPAVSFNADPDPAAF